MSSALPVPSSEIRMGYLSFTLSNIYPLTKRSWLKLDSGTCVPATGGRPYLPESLLAKLDDVTVPEE